MKVFLSAVLLMAALAFPVVGEESERLTSEINPESVIGLMNHYRRQNQLPPLHAEPRLMKAAEDRMRDMEEMGFWAHESPEGRSPFFWLHFRSYRFRVAGENLARGFETNDLLVSSWMDSPGHRGNILGVEFHHVGVAVIEGATTGRYPGKSVVVLFARE
jgi:uncharacterized protein YkwD